MKLELDSDIEEQLPKCIICGDDVFTEDEAVGGLCIKCLEEEVYG